MYEFPCVCDGVFTGTRILLLCKTWHYWCTAVYVSCIVLFIIWYHSNCCATTRTACCTPVVLLIIQQVEAGCFYFPIATDCCWSTYHGYKYSSRYECDRCCCQILIQSYVSHSRWYSSTRIFRETTGTHEASQQVPGKVPGQLTCIYSSTAVLRTSICTAGITAVYHLDTVLLLSLYSVYSVRCCASHQVRIMYLLLWSVRYELLYVHDTPRPTGVGVRSWWNLDEGHGRHSIKHKA